MTAVGLLRVLRGHMEPVAVATFGRKRQSLLSADAGGTIRVWDFHAGQQLGTIDSPDLGLRRAIFTPDGKGVIGCGNNPRIRLWELETAALVREFRGHSATVTAVYWIPNSRRFISSSMDVSLIIWKADSGDIERQFGMAPNFPDAAPASLEDLARLDGHITWIRDVVVLPDGKRALSAGNEGVLFEWDLETGELVERFIGHRTVIMTLSLSPDGRYVASLGSDRELIFWDLDHGRAIHRWRHLSERSPAIGFLPDSTALAIGGEDGVVQVIDVRSGKETSQLEVADVGIVSLAFSAEAEIVCGCEDGLIRICPIATSGP
jgi:WD40 repeat protein